MCGILASLALAAWASAPHPPLHRGAPDFLQCTPVHLNWLELLPGAATQGRTGIQEGAFPLVSPWPAVQWGDWTPPPGTDSPGGLQVVKSCRWRAIEGTSFQVDTPTALGLSGLLGKSFPSASEPFFLLQIHHPELQTFTLTIHLAEGSDACQREEART